MVRQGEGRDLRAGMTVTWVGLVTNILLFVAKAAAGIFGHSQALLADAVHSLSDLLTDAIVLIGLAMGRKAPDVDHHFGHARFETIASAVVGLSLILVGLYIGYRSASSIYHHKDDPVNLLALVGALASIGIKELLYQYTVRVGRQIRSLAVVANAWHHRSDALSSVAVAIGITGALINPNWHVLDAVAALVVALLIIRVGGQVMARSAREMVDTAPDAETMARIRLCVSGVPGVLGYHKVKVRTLGGIHLVQIHIEVDNTLNVTEGHRIAKQVELCLFRDIEDLGEVIIHVDPVSGPGL